MQAQSHLSVNCGGGSGFEAAAEDNRDAVVRELRRGQELTARLHEEALRALQGKGQAEATAAFILREVSRAFTVCISIIGGAASAAPRPADSAVSVAAPRRAINGVRRTTTLTSSPHSDDGHQWRKYGQKKINNTKFQRHYFRCRERRCPATKQVQKHSEADPALFVIIYVNDHTCHTPEPEAAASDDQDQLLDFSGLPRRQQQQRGEAIVGGLLHDVRRRAGCGDTLELERQALVSSLAWVLREAAPPEAPPLLQGGRASTSLVLDDNDASSELPTVGVDDGFGGLDIIDYNVTDAMCLGASSDSGSLMPF